MDKVDRVTKNLRKTIIVAVDRNNAIGFGNDLPWGRGLKDDLANFKHLTSGGTVIMGRKTFESIGSKPLPDRENIVVSRSGPMAVPGVLTALSLEAAYALARYETFIIGGGQIYEQAMNDVDRLIVTYVDAEFPDAEVYFPRVDCMAWREIDRRHFEADERNVYGFDIVEYERE